MRGFLIEYTENGFPTTEVQLEVEAPHFDSGREVLSIWEFENVEERDQILADLRKFRDQQRKGLA